MYPSLYRNRQIDFITIPMWAPQVFEDLSSSLHGFFMLNTPRWILQGFGTLGG